MAWSATENFDSYTPGNALGASSGGSGWTANWVTNLNPVTVQTAPTGMSGNAALTAWTSGDGGDASRTFTAITSGTISFKMMAAQTNRNGALTLGDNTVPISRCYVQFASDGNIKAVGSGTNVLQAYTANTVYTIKIKFGHTSGNFAVSIDGGAYSADFDCAGTGSQVNNISLSNQNAATSSFYFDDIRDGESVATTLATRKSLLGVGM